MPIRNPPELASFDAEGALATARERAGDALLVCAEYTTEDFTLLYVADEVVDRYGGLEGLVDVGEAIHSYLRLDFEERALFDELYPPVDETRAFATYTDYVVAVRIVDSGEGLYLSFRPGTEITGVVDAAGEIVRA